MPLGQLSKKAKAKIEDNRDHEVPILRPRAHYVTATMKRERFVIMAAIKKRKKADFDKIVELHTGVANRTRASFDAIVTIYRKD